MEDTRVGSSEQKDDPAEVARQGYEALMQGKERVVSGSLVEQAAHLRRPPGPGQGEGGGSPTDGRAGLGGQGRDEEEVRSR